jgi:sarcosine oxidase subunit beta
LAQPGSEVVVVGGGVIGTSIAYHLANTGCKVTLVERDQLATQASGASAGGVRQLGRDPREMPLAIRSIERWHSLEEELEADVEFRMGGQLLVAETEGDAEELKRRVLAQRDLGLNIRFVEGLELRHIAPDLAPHVKWGAYTDNDGQASARKTTLAFAAAASWRGARLLTDTLVSSISLQAGKVRGVETTAGNIACDWLVLAAGAWNPVLARQLGIYLPITTMALQMMSTGAHTPVLAPTVGALGRKLSLKQVPNGNFVIGGGWPGVIDFERRVGATRLESIRGSIEHSSAILPLLGSLPLERVWIGLEALVVDEIPILGALPGIENVTLAAGFSGHGFALSPIVGQLLSELIVDGEASVSIDAFSFNRFADMDIAAMEPEWQAG